MEEITKLFIILMLVKTVEGNSDGKVDQALVDYIGSNVSLRAGVINNFNKDADDYVPMELSLFNKGDVTITNGKWKIYFNNLYGAKVENSHCGLKVGHVNGDLYYFTPSTNFTSLRPGMTSYCIWHQRLWNVAISDFFPNWFVASEGLTPRIISSTNETFSFINAYDTPQKWKRSREDMYNPFTPQERYRLHKMKNKRYEASIIPTPFHVNRSKYNMTTRLSSADGWVVVNSTVFPTEAKYLADRVSVPLVSTKPSRKYVEILKVDSPKMNSEAYHLNITDDCITITAREDAGAFYAVQSLITLWYATEEIIPVMFVEDKPRFQYRGLMIDVARSFKPKEWIFELIDVMAIYKLNKLHLHLSDDGAWRLQIPSLPELTEMGSRRCQDHAKNVCLLPQRGSGPDTTTSGSGYYTSGDYRDILRYAADRHIAVIPEFDMPGHSRAAIASMDYRSSKIRNNDIDTRNVTSYTLTDVNIDDNVRSIQHWQGNAMNPCLNSTYGFVNQVLDELIEMHKAVMDLKIFHMGGDEVPDGSWDSSPACMSMPGPTNTIALKRHFVKRVAEIVASKGLDIAAWEDGLYADDKPNPITDLTSRRVYSYMWNNMWEQGRGNRSAQFADAGYKVILTMATHMYLDHSYEPDPEEIGLHWASRYTNTEKTFGFMPDDIFANADVTKMGHPVNLAEICQNNWCPKPRKPENVIGLQGTMFSDQIRNRQQMHHALFPRLIAIAERAWHKAPWENIVDNDERQTARRDDWERFANILGYQELPRLERQGIDYRIPPPGAVLEDSVLKVNTMFPNHVVHMSTDGGSMWRSMSDSGQLLPGGNLTIQLKAIAPITNRSSRSITLETNIEPPATDFKPTSVSAAVSPTVSASVFATSMSANSKVATAKSSTPQLATTSSIAASFTLCLSIRLMCIVITVLLEIRVLC